MKKITVFFVNGTNKEFEGAYVDSDKDVFIIRHESEFDYSNATYIPLCNVLYIDVEEN